jgi:hypothetical protein
MRFNRFSQLITPIIAGLFLAVHIPAAGGAETWESATPTDVYHLAKSIDDSLTFMYSLTSKLTKKRISDNLKPRNVYMKALTVAEEFNTLHPNAIDSAKLSEAANIDASRTKPGDVYALLNLIKNYLITENAFTESPEEMDARTPNDVFQMLRQVSMHHYEIAKKKNLVTGWGTPARVYEAVVTGILPAVGEIADDAKIAHEDFPFPKQPVGGVAPRNVYNLLYHVYNNISQFYMNKGGYDSVFLTKMNDCDEISPADVFDLVQIIVGELKARSGNKMMATKTASRYTTWKNSKEKIVPGDVFRLIQYNFMLTKKALETEK